MKKSVSSVKSVVPTPPRKPAAAKTKNPAAVALGSRGGSANTPAQHAHRARVAGIAARARWDKWRADRDARIQTTPGKISGAAILAASAEIARHTTAKTGIREITKGNKS